MEIAGKIKKSDLLKEKSVKVFIENFDFDIPFHVVGFTVGIQDGSIILIAGESQNDKITDEQVKILETCSVRQNVIIDHIMVVGPDGQKRQVGNITMTIE